MEAQGFEPFFESQAISRDLIDVYLKHRQIYQAAIKEITTKLEILDEEFRVAHEYNPIHHIESRLKNPKSILKKLERKKAQFTKAALDASVQDVAGVRVICNYIEDVYTISGLLIHQSDIELLRERDYIAHPKENGYRSLHLIVRVPVFLREGVEAVKVEVQIRTIAMDFWASLEHQLKYKADDEISDDLRYRLQSSAEHISRIDIEMQAINTELRKGRGIV